MKRILFSVLAVTCIYITGCCSIPRVASYKELYSIAKEEKKKKGSFNKSKVVLIKDFRGHEISGQNLAAFKEKVEKYISDHPDLNETAKNNLRELKVTAGTAKEEVKLLLGEPDRVNIDKKDLTCQTWIYRTDKNSTFTVIFLPVFFGHEEYFLYFKDSALALIERHYLEQTFYSSGSGTSVQAARY